MALVSERTTCIQDSCGIIGCLDENNIDIKILELSQKEVYPKHPNLRNATYN